MKLFLFGGAEISLHQVEPLKTLIKKVIMELHPPSVLHIPFARLSSDEEEWEDGWFKALMKDTGIEILDARNDSDVNKAVHSAVFINGGHDRYALVDTINNNKKILYLILNAPYIVAESSGSMLMGEFMRGNKGDDSNMKGLGVLKHTVIEPHYTERSSQQLLSDEMKKSGMEYGVGIDCVTAIVVDPLEFPAEWEKIGSGNVALVGADH